jgi:hypothetical protein
MPSYTCELNCTNDAFKQCLVCSRYYCSDHESKTEPDYCNDCVTEAHGELKVTENVHGNDDTVGRLIEPVGPYFVSTMKSIAEMSDDELSRMINSFILKVRSLEQASDRTRITLSAMQLEQNERLSEKSRKQRGVHVRDVKTNSDGTISMPSRKKAESKKEDEEKTADILAAISQIVAARKK